MKPIKEALELTSVNEINMEIKERQELKSVMVGRLYPIILQGEIDRLVDLKNGLLYPKGGFVEC